MNESHDEHAWRRIVVLILLVVVLVLVVVVFPWGALLSAFQNAPTGPMLPPPAK